MTCALLRRLSGDVRASIWRDYLGEHSISIALLRNTCPAIRAELQGFDRLVSSSKLDQCSVSTVESVLPPVSDQTLDWPHWLSLFCCAASAGDVSAVMHLLTVDLFTEALFSLANQVTPSLARNVPIHPKFELVRRALSDFHDRIKATDRAWLSWSHIYKVLDSNKMLQLVWLSFCFVERETLDERVLSMSKERLSALNVNEESTLAMCKLVGIAIGEKGTADDLTSTGELLSVRSWAHLYASCANCALKARRFDSFMACYASSFFFNDAIVVALQYNDMTVLEYALANKCKLPLGGRLILHRAVASGNARACRLLIEATGSSVPLPDQAELNCSRMFAEALLRSVDDARFFLAAYPDMAKGDVLRGTFIAARSETSHQSSASQFWEKTWQVLLYMEDGTQKPYNGLAHKDAALDRTRLLFFVETATSSDNGVDRQELCRFMLKSLVSGVVFTETLADALLSLLQFPDEESRLIFGKLLALWSSLDSAYQWVCFHFPGCEVNAFEASLFFSSLIESLSDSTAAYMQCTQFVTESASSMMRLIRASGNIIPLLDELPHIAWTLPLAVVALLLQRHADALPNARLPTHALEAMALRLFQRGQKHLFCKFYHSVFRPVEGIVNALRNAIPAHYIPRLSSATNASFDNVTLSGTTSINTDSSRSTSMLTDVINCRVRNWLLQNEPQLCTIPA